MRNLLFLPFLTLLLFSSCKQTEKEAQEAEKNVASEVENETEDTEASEDIEDTGTILFFGDSLTAAMGLDPAEGYPAEIQKIIDSLGLNYSVVNAGLSGETTAAGKNRINWVLNQEVDIFVLALGANDGLRGIAVEETRKNLKAIIEMVRQKNPDVEIVLAGMQIPPNLGTEYTTDFKELFPELARQNNVHLIPFLLEGVAGDPELNQQDGIHPTAQGYDIVARNVWEDLEPVITEKD